MTLTAESILDVLDRSAAADWQDFCGTAALEYHALRLIAVRSRAGDDWGVVLEAIRGSLINNTLSVAAGYWTKVYGSRVTIGLHLVIETRNLPLDLPERRNRKSVRLDGLEIGGPAGTLVGDDGMIERFHLRPGRVCNFEGYAESPLDTLAIRAYMAAFPGSLWRPAEIPAAFTGVEDGEILLVSDAFHHVLGPEILDDTREDLRALTVSPSASESYRSLAVAIASRDGSRFAPGASNLDWRKWAIYEDSDADPSLPPVGSPLPFVPRADVVQPEVPAIATGDATRDEHLRTLTGAFADLHQEGALRALVHRPDNALPAILLGYLSDATLAIKPQVGTGGGRAPPSSPRGAGAAGRARSPRGALLLAYRRVREVDDARARCASGSAGRPAADPDRLHTPGRAGALRRRRRDCPTPLGQYDARVRAKAGDGQPACAGRCGLAPRSCGPGDR